VPRLNKGSEGSQSLKFGNMICDPTLIPALERRMVKMKTEGRKFNALQRAVIDSVALKSAVDGTKRRLKFHSEMVERTSTWIAAYEDVVAKVKSLGLHDPEDVRRELKKEFAERSIDPAKIISAQETLTSCTVQVGRISGWLADYEEGLAEAVAKLKTLGFNNVKAAQHQWEKECTKRGIDPATIMPEIRRQT